MRIVTRTSTSGSCMLAVAAISLIACAPSATADPANGNVACHPSTDAGVEVDTCTGIPNADDGAGRPGDHVSVVPQLCLGIGFGGCDD